MIAVWPDRADLPDPNSPERAAFRAIRCLPGEIAPNVLVPGDPARAARIANEWLTDAKPVMVQREFHSYTGNYQGVPVSVISTGVGSAGAAMVIQDLGKLGCDVVVRVGTAGSCVKEVKPGDNVIGTAAVRDEGLTRKFVPEIYPAVANLQVTNALCDAAAKQDTHIHTGVIHTSDARVRKVSEQFGTRAAECVQQFAEAFGAFANAAYDDAVALLEPVVADSYLIGGSNPQRRIVEDTYLEACMRTARYAQARAILQARNRQNSVFDSRILDKINEASDER